MMVCQYQTHSKSEYEAAPYYFKTVHDIFTKHGKDTKHHQAMDRDGLLVVLGFYGPLRQCFSLYQAVSREKGRTKGEITDERKNVQTTPIRTYCKRN